MKRIAFQGEKGAYSEEAIHQTMGPDAETMPCRDLEGIFEAVETGQAESGVLPVENSTAGSIYQAYDLLLNHDLRVCGEIIFRVRHALLAVPGTSPEAIRRVRSHPQALAQSERYLADRGWLAESAYDTAGSARDLAADPRPEVAVIASRLAGQLYGLEELDYGIEDSRQNYTRFFILSLEEPPRAQRNKTSLVFCTRHHPGALYECMGEFAQRGINLCKIESRPRLNLPWQYIFYLDFEGHCRDALCEAALMGLLRRASFVKLLGSYPAATTPLPGARAGEE
ncbi:MAG: prephenate dehydratase [Anaerolineae bacterium]|nr:prephenate dehydratase [Anaerolineae bacterium]MDX9829656.1 prephenate dehydratase [Anaerolineae bacterium]